MRCDNKTLSGPLMCVRLPFHKKPDQQCAVGRSWIGVSDWFTRRMRVTSGGSPSEMVHGSGCSVCLPVGRGSTLSTPERSGGREDQMCADRDRVLFSQGHTHRCDKAVDIESETSADYDMARSLRLRGGRHARARRARWEYCWPIQERIVSITSFTLMDRKDSRNAHRSEEGGERMEASVERVGFSKLRNLVDLEEKETEKIKEFLRYLEVYPSGYKEFEVMKLYEGYGVNLQTHKSTCRYWDLTRIPYVHVSVVNKSELSTPIPPRKRKMSGKPKGKKKKHPSEANESNSKKEAHVQEEKNLLMQILDRWNHLLKRKNMFKRKNMPMHTWKNLFKRNNLPMMVMTINR
ncbi:hypothetical protein Tco_1215427 [Tanacetum coccineum]